MRHALGPWLTLRAGGTYVAHHPGEPGGEREAVGSVFCTQCGQQNPEDSRFCARCGAPVSGSASAPQVSAETTSTISLSALEGALEGEGQPTPEPATEEHAPLEGLPPGSALLVVKRGPNAGSRFLLDADVTTAGRHPESDIFLDDVTVSRRHAEFVRDGEGFTVRDVGSLNGTYLNRGRIDAASLAGGDEVQIGKYRLVFLTGAKGSA
ncbi:MAG: domain containing protein [Frankiales bacterium]|nr:domain containing protein [Frankiales bacterium]